MSDCTCTSAKVRRAEAARLGFDAGQGKARQRSAGRAGLLSILQCVVSLAGSMYLYVCVSVCMYVVGCFGGTSIYVSMYP